MMRWFWIDGRFAWPFVTAIVFLSLALLIADFAWRVLVIPLESLVALVFALCVAFALTGIALKTWFGRRKRSS